MTNNNSIRIFLQGRGCPEHVIRRGLKGLVENWERAVREAVDGYPYGLDDYLNDMDTRQLIAEALKAVPQPETSSILRRLRAADSRFRERAVPAGRCLWGETEASRSGWAADREWWYFYRPASAGPELLADLQEQPPEPD